MESQKMICLKLRVVESCRKRFCIYDVSAPYTVHKPRAIFNRSILIQLIQSPFWSKLIHMAMF